jgi:hypothetical protein
MLGRSLFRWRGAIGVLAFGLVFSLARPTFGSCLLGVPLLILGFAVRFWASGYIGVEGRVNEIGARRKIASGPYRLLRHPLYIGNSLLVVGMLLALRPALWLSAVVLVGFVAEYAFIVAAEERQLELLELGRTQRAEVRRQKSEVRLGADEGRVARDEGFSPSRAMCEWRTWVVTGVAWGMAMMKALLVRS